MTRTKPSPKSRNTTPLAKNFVAGVKSPKAANKGGLTRIQGRHLTGKERELLRAHLKSGANATHVARLMGIDPRSARREAHKLGLMDGRLPGGVVPEQPADPIIVRRLKDQLTRASERANSAERRAIASETLRQSVFGLAAEPLLPRNWSVSPDSGKAAAEAIVLPLSDIHMGEVIDLAQMGGRNSYNRDIARLRLRRYFESIVKLGTEHWSGPPPAVIYLVLLGDLVSGEIHEELAKTNDLLAIPAVRELSECLISGINLLLKSFKCDVRVLSLPGNHGRTTRKPEAKGFALNSYDTLTAWSVESWFSAKGEKRVSFEAPASGDALVKINGWNMLFTHGDRIGSRGGAGFIGPAATAARGMQRLIQDYAAEGEIVDAVVIGHFHTPIELEQGFVNGCLGGPSEYSRSGRFRSHPASQWMLTVHPSHGVARRWKVQVGHPSEGSIYKGRSS